MVVNGLWPSGLPELGAPATSLDPDGAVARVFAATTVVARQARRQREGVSAWLEGERAAGRAGAPVLALPWRWQGFTGFGDLEQVLAGLERPDLSAR